ncbi:crinkler family protein [Gigaspora margarita]|uniref:Crinkler family protein n=1 Tax=Gigaspora margarita TaxID=4874 RepID=A0A8H4ASX7_GIGMA|nr:crinkler family protein [Gigaspora margarita]
MSTLSNARRLSCFVLGGIGRALFVNICDNNQISDKDEVSIKDLTIDHLKEIIWKKIKNWRDIGNVKDAYELNLWKIEAPLEKLNKFLTKIEIEYLSGKEMDFQIDSENPHSILAWIQNFNLTRAYPALLVELFGAQFTLCGRKNTINTLWGGDVVNSYGILNRFKNYCSANPKIDPRLLNDDEVKSILENAIFLNITYRNGSAFSDFDVDISAEASLALRILHGHFVHKQLNYLKFRDTIGKKAKLLMLYLALHTIYKSKCKEVENTEKLAIIVDIDDVNKLYDLDREVFRKLIACIGSMICNSKIFFVPILAGKVAGSVRSVISNSMNQVLQLPLQLLDTSHMLLIACDIGLDEAFVYQNNLFRCIIADIGGQVRALKIFYKLLWNEMKTSKLENIDLVNIMHLLKGRLQLRYDFSTYANQISPVLANAILERPVNENDSIYLDKDKSQHVSYKRLKSLGILTLEPTDDIKFYIHLPYLWVWLLIKNIVFECKTIKLKELLKGALYSDVDMDVDVHIPNYNSVQVHYLNKQYPMYESILDSNGHSCNISYNDNDKIYKNGYSAECDRFSFLTINREQLMLLALQIKWRDLGLENPQKIDDKLIGEEYRKVKNIARKIGVNNWLLSILSNCSSTFDKNMLPMRCAIVDQSNFTEFYGRIYLSQAQFAAAHDKVCVNSAKFFELRVIDGVGPTIAKDIIDGYENSKKKYADGKDLCKLTKFSQISLDCVEY